MPLPPARSCAWRGPFALPGPLPQRPHRAWPPPRLQAGRKGALAGDQPRSCPYLPGSNARRPQRGLLLSRPAGVGLRARPSAVPLPAPLPTPSPTEAPGPHPSVPGRTASSPGGACPLLSQAAATLPECKTQASFVVTLAAGNNNNKDCLSFASVSIAGQWQVFLFIRSVFPCVPN